MQKQSAEHKASGSQWVDPHQGIRRIPPRCTYSQGTVPRIDSSSQHPFCEQYDLGPLSIPEYPSISSPFH